MTREQGAPDTAAQRQQAAAALQAGDAVAACELAEAAMRAAARPGSARCCALLTPARAVAERLAGVVFEQSGSAVASLALALDAAAQIPEWSQPYMPPPLRLLRLRDWTALAPNVLVSRAGYLLDDYVGYPPSELWRHDVPAFPGFAAAAGHIVVCEHESKSVRIAGPVFYLNASPNYAAWMMGDLPRLALLRETADAQIVLHGAVQAFHRDALALAGIDASRIREVPADTRIDFAHLYYATSTYMHHAPNADALNWLRQTLRRKLGERNREKPLYLARRHYAASRPLLNEEAVIGLFARRGFRAIDPERHAVAEQLAMAAVAPMLAAPYGAALANALFAPPGAAALVIATKQQPEFARLLSGAGIAFAHVVAAPVKLREGRNVSESFGYEADLVALERALDLPAFKPAA